MNMQDDKLLPLHIVAKRLNMDARTVQGWCRDRRIECVRNKMSGRYSIRESVVMSILVDIPAEPRVSHIVRK
jgi:predicted site-specific integrase-resolvase